MRTITVLLIALSFAFTVRAQNYWYEVTSGTVKKLLSVSFADTQTGYISGADGTLLKTTDGGSNWAPVSHSGMTLTAPYDDIVHVNFVDAQVGYAIVSNHDNPTYAGLFYKTTNGGMNWTVVTPGNIAPLTTFLFDEHNGYVAGSAFFAGHAINKQTAGVWGTEKYLHSPPEEFIHTVDFIDSLRGVAGGSQGLVYRTFDAGQTWDTVLTYTDSIIHSIRWLNDSVLIGACDEQMGGIMYSSDTGKTWMADMSTLTFAYPKMKAVARSVKDSIIVAGASNFGHQGIIIWVPDLSSLPSMQMTPQSLYAIDMADDSIAYIVGDSGLIMTNRVVATSVPRTVPGARQLNVFPNPFRDVCYTAFSERHQVRVYDLRGAVVFTNREFCREHSIRMPGTAGSVYIIEALLSDGTIIRSKLVTAP